MDTKKRCLYSGRIGLQFQSTKQLNYEIISRLISKSISFLIKFSFRILLNGRQLCRTLVESLIISLNPNANIGSISVTIWIHTSFIMCLWCQIDTWIMPSSRVLDAWHIQFITPSNYCVKTPETACAVFPLPTVQFTRFEWLDRSNSIVRTRSIYLRGFERRTLNFNFKFKENVPWNIKGERRLNNQIRMALEYIRNQIKTHSDCTLLAHLLYLTSVDCTLLACIRYSPNTLLLCNIDSNDRSTGNHCFFFTYNIT